MITRLVLASRRLGFAPSHRAVFGAIRRQRAWGGGETLSGPGSTEERGSAFRVDLIALLERLQVEILLDAGCGDGGWIAPVAARVGTYIGADVVDVRGGEAFLRADITSDPLPRADVILSRDCLVHFSFKDIRRALRNFQRSGSQYLLTTTFPDCEANADIRTGDWRPLNFERPPFSFSTPLAMIDERSAAMDKRLALWPLDACGF